MDWTSVFVLFIHIGAAITWIGGLAYLRFILLPALTRAAPTVQGPLVVDVGPKTVRFLLRSGEITIAAGLANFFLMGGMEKARVAHLWAGSIGVGFLGALAIYIIGQAVTKPTTTRIADTVRAVIAGNPPADAPAQLEALAQKQRNMLSIQLGIGIAVTFLMALARFS